MKITNLKKAASFALSLIMFLAGMSFLPFINLNNGVNASAASYVPTRMGLENASFVSSSGNTPKSADSWSASAMGSASSQNIISGVVGLTPDDLGINFTTVYKLNEYPEIDSSIRTPFSNSMVYPNGDPFVLMIHNYGSESAYAYTSSTMMLEPNRYYRISAWVRTTDFSDGKGAYIRINNDNDANNDIEFAAINTTGKFAATGGWGQYTFYIENNSFASQTISLSLQVGHIKTISRTPTPTNSATEITTRQTARGVAFFDNVSAEEISADLYYGAQESETVIITSYKTPLSAQLQLQNNDFELPIANGWSPIEGSGSTATRFAGTVATNEDVFQARKDAYGIEENPQSPQGGGYVLAIRNGVSGAFGFESSKLNIQMHRKYLLTVMVKGFNLSGELTINVKGENSKSEDEFTETVSFTPDSNNENNSLYNWEQVSIFIAGSSLRDYEVYVQLCLGVEGAPQSGIAFFDNVLLQTLDEEDYSSNSENANHTINMDADSSPSIDNGDFNLVGSFEDYIYPLSAKSWTSTWQTSPISNSINANNVTSGIVNLSPAHFEANRANYGMAINPVSSTSFKGPNALMIYSPTQTLFGYKSPSFTIEANEAKKVVVSLSTQNIGGSGVSLILKKGTNIISSIDNIESDGNFSNYTFYIQANSVAHDLTIELWLGRPDDKNNKRWASGHVFFDSVVVSALSLNETFESKHSQYLTYSVSGDVVMNLPFASYTFVNEYFTAYNLREESAIKTPYNWNLDALSADIESGVVMGGIVDIGSAAAMQSLGNPLFNNLGAKEGQTHALVLRNSIKTTSRIASIVGEELAANSYYCVTVRLKTTHISEDEYGAWIRLDGIDGAEINEINTQTRQQDEAGENKYVDYKFYIAVGEEAKSFTVSIGLGNSNHSKNHTRGSVFVSMIETQAVERLDYDNGVADIVAYENEEDGAELPDNIAKVDFNTIITEEVETESEEEPNDMLWWLIPSLIFGLALLVALIGLPTKTLLAKRRVRVSARNSYDRSRALKGLRFGEGEQEGEDEPELEEGEQISELEEFSDEQPQEPEAAEQAEQAEQQESQETAKDDLDEFSDK